MDQLIVRYCQGKPQVRALGGSASAAAVWFGFGSLLACDEGVTLCFRWLPSGRLDGRAEEPTDSGRRPSGSYLRPVPVLRYQFVTNTASRRLDPRLSVNYA